jgi:type IV pilus assembly protein PilE
MQVFPQRFHCRPPGSGFTLLELLIVLAIVALLAMISVPAYEASVRKGRRSDAISALLQAANRQEQRMLRRSSYTLDMRELGYGADPALSEAGYYIVNAGECDSATIAICYVLTASPAAGSPQLADSGCTGFSLDSSGRRTAIGAEAASCW